MFRFPQSASVSARLVQRNETPCLLADFKTSNPPLLWQLDLEKLSNHTISLRETNGDWDLGLLLPQGDFTSVAHFDERSDAETAYDAVRRAILQGEPTQWPFRFRWGIWGAVVLLLFFFFSGMFHLTPPPVNETQTASADQNAADASSSSLSRRIPQALEDLNKTLSPPESKEIQTGVPVSADDVLPQQQ